MAFEEEKKQKQLMDAVDEEKGAYLFVFYSMLLFIRFAQTILFLEGEWIKGPEMRWKHS